MKKIILLLTILIVILSGCATQGLKENSEGVYEISFKRSLTKEEMESLDGKKVEITGFYSVVKAIDGSFAYLMSDPFHTCLYCTEDAAHSFSNTLAMHPKEGEVFEYTYLPVTAKGILKIEETDDDFGNHYNYKIIEVEVEETKEEKLTEEAKIYKKVVEQQFVEKFNIYMNEIAYLADYNALGLATSQLQEINHDIVVDMKELLENGENPDLKEIYDIVVKAEILAKELNNLLKEKKWTEMNSKISEAQRLYDEYFEWITRPQF